MEGCYSVFGTDRLSIPFNSEERKGSRLAGHPAAEGRPARRKASWDRGQGRRLAYVQTLTRNESAVPWGRY